VSALLVRGDVEMAATCTVTYIDATQLLACGHPILQAGPVSLPMTSADVVATLASPLNAFKIINTGREIGAFTEDRDAAIRGVLGARARMIPMRLEMGAAAGEGDKNGDKRTLNVEILDLPTLTPQAAMVVVFQALQQSNRGTLSTSYHVTGGIELAGGERAPLDYWAVPSESMPAPISAAVQLAEQFNRIYTNGSRTGASGAIKGIELRIEPTAERALLELESAHLAGSGQARAGETVTVEIDLQPWQQPMRRVQLQVALPGRLAPGPIRLLVSDGGTLDRAMEQPRAPGRVPKLDALLAETRQRHAADRLYASLLEPMPQAAVDGQTLSGLPLSVASALEPMRQEQLLTLKGESVLPVAELPLGVPITGFQVISLHILPGGGLN
jgi:hypothetical protein